MRVAVWYTGVQVSTFANILKSVEFVASLAREYEGYTVILFYPNGSIECVYTMYEYVDVLTGRGNKF